VGAAGQAWRTPPPRSPNASAEGTPASPLAWTSARARGRWRIHLGNRVRCGRSSPHRSGDPQDHTGAGRRLSSRNRRRWGKRLVRRPRTSGSRPARAAHASAGRDAGSCRRCTGMAGAGQPLPVRRRSGTRDHQPDRCALGERGRPAGPRCPSRRGSAGSRGGLGGRFRLGQQFCLEHACASEHVLDHFCAASRDRKQWWDDWPELAGATTRRQSRRPHSARARCAGSCGRRRPDGRGERRLGDERRRGEADAHRPVTECRRRTDQSPS